MAANGYLPDSVLAPIFASDGKTVVGRLTKEAAAAWNAMCAHARSQGLATPIPDGPESSYRTYAQQVQLKAYWTAQGNPGNAATPGTSNHGWGLAVDSAPNDGVHHGEVVDQIGAPFGFSKAWSDAPWEPWHHKYKSGVWFPAVFTPDYSYPKHSRGPMVLLFTQRLVKLGYLDRRWFHFTQGVETAVKKFQKDHHFTADGVVGPTTWAAIKRRAAAKGKK
jgi:hypothetical protein